MIEGALNLRPDFELTQNPPRLMDEPDCHKDKMEPSIFRVHFKSDVRIYQDDLKTER
jgi:hypothetical protein